MSATRTFTVLKALAYIVGDKWGYQTAEKARQNDDLLAYCGLHGDLGGSEDVGIITGAATWQPVRGYREFLLNGDSLGGLTLDLVAFYKTSNVATSVQVRLRNVTDSTNAALGSASASTTVVKEAVTVTLAAGDKNYRLEVLGDATNHVFGWGYLRFRKVPV